MDILGAYPFPAIGRGAVYTIRCGIFKVLLVPLLLGGVCQELVDMFQGNVISSAATGRTLLGDSDQNSGSRHTLVAYAQGL